MLRYSDDQLRHLWRLGNEKCVHGACTEECTPGRSTCGKHRTDRRVEDWERTAARDTCEERLRSGIRRLPVGATVKYSGGQKAWTVREHLPVQGVLRVVMERQGKYGLEIKTAPASQLAAFGGAPGRPKSEPAEKLDARCSFRLTNAERTAVARAAKRAKLTDSQWARSVLVDAAYHELDD